MLSLRLTALSCAAAFLAGCVLVISIWSYVNRGEMIAKQKRAMASKDSVIELVADRNVNEQGITNDTAERKSNLERTVPDARKQPMSPAVRAAIDSLP